MRQKHRFHGLKKIKVRQTWNKYNLYNLSRLQPQRTASATFFQQKWSAKSISRAYHGEYIREKQWQNMFRPFTPAVVPLDPGELATFDGSEQAEGRGSGKDVDPRARVRPQAQIPYMAMVYGPIERRLDSAIFRALFASSARQARQFVVHGAVKVNGKKMIYPGYLLNPGDMFQVEPDRVMYATGVQKVKMKDRTRRAWVAEKKRAAEEKQARIAAEEAAQEAAQEEVNEAQAEESQPEAEADPETPSATAIKKEMRKKRKEALGRIKTVLAKGKTTLSGKRIQELRALIPRIHEVFNKNHLSSIDEALKPIMSQLTNPSDRNDRSASSSSSSSTPEEASSESSSINSPENLKADKYRTAAEREEIKAILKVMDELRENPVDPTKPYATPWKPRPFMAPFAFVPRYLEVNHNICAAVYLRHPVARPGLAEVPSPFAIETNQLTFNWYLRRR